MTRRQDGGWFVRKYTKQRALRDMLRDAMLTTADELQLREMAEMERQLSKLLERRKRPPPPK